MFGENPMLVPVKQEEPEPEPETIEQKIEKVGEFIQNQCYTDKEYQELMTGIHNQMAKLLMPNKKPVNPPKIMDFKPLNLKSTPSKPLTKKTKRYKERSNYNLFLEKVEMNKAYGIEELTQLYNETFQSDITTKGFGKLSKTAENFHVLKLFRNGKYLTGYIRYR